MKTKEEFESLREERSKLATSQQRAAADPLKSVWVEASAGTGKTKVLSDRVLRLLLNGVRPQRILCLTYTKAAAVEMQTRISERLSLWSVLPEADIEESLTELLGEEVDSAETMKRYKAVARTLFAVLLDTPGGVKIKTLHAFCQEILRRFPLEAGISPYFEVLEDGKASEILAQIRKDMLEELKSGSENSLAASLQYLTHLTKDTGFTKIMEDITKNRSDIAEFMTKYKSLADFDKALVQKLHINPAATEEGLIADFMAAIKTDDLRADIAALNHGSEANQRTAAALENILSRGLRPEDYPEYKEIKHISRVLKSVTIADPEFSTRKLFEQGRIAELEDNLCKIRLYHGTMAVMTLAEELNDRYTAYKKKLSSFDHEDTIVLTRKLLSNSDVTAWVLYKLDGGIDHILIDEAQDTSPKQWDIVKSLSEDFFSGSGRASQPRTVFVVGDRKQSIYSFQGADPDKFDKMSAYFSHQAGTNFQKVNLAVSFRSSAAVLNMVNALFAKPEVAEGVAAKDEKVNHQPYRAGEYGKVELWPLFLSDKNKKSAKSKESAETEVEVPEQEEVFPPLDIVIKKTAKNRQAHAMAEKIKQLIAETKNSLRPLHYKDFMILVQHRDVFVQEFIRACKELDVNISGADRLNLSQQIAVQDLISLGRFLLLPQDDLSLAEVLKSPLFGLTDDDLIKLCPERKGATLWSKLGDMPEYAEIYKQLQTLFNMLDFVRPYELYNYVLTNMNGRFHFIERMGMEVEDALDEFINQTLAYEQDNIPSLQSFISWVSHLETDIKRQTEQKDNDAVRLMTVHGSKGLQARVVFLPDTVYNRANKQERKMLFDESLIYYPLNTTCYDTICKDLNEEKGHKEQEEKRRLLYVALTRAEDRLYICGSSSRENVNEKTWYALCRQIMQETGVKNGNKLELEEPEVVVNDKNKEEYRPQEMPPLEKWLTTPAAAEGTLAKPYTPSKMKTDEETDSVSPLTESGNFYRRGTLIHKLLQFLPQSTDDKALLVHEFLEKSAADFSTERRQQIETEVLQLLHNPEFSDIFGENSRAEVPIIGEVDGKIISAQLDRLILLPHKTMIVDFKTNCPAAKNLAETSPVYINQLQTYARLIQKIYPQKPVETYILWTNETRLMRVS